MTVEIISTKQNKSITHLENRSMSLPFSTWLQATDKRTDACSRHFMIWKINSGLVWAAGKYMKKKWGPIMSNFWGRFFLCFQGQKIFFWKYHSVRVFIGWNLSVIWVYIHEGREQASVFLSVFSTRFFYFILIQRELCNT